MKREANGHRYIERITECVPLDQEREYPHLYREESKLEDKLVAFMDTVVEYFRRSTDRVFYEARNVVEFRDGRYVAVQSISEMNIREMRVHMTAEDQAALAAFLAAHWGSDHG
jgi:pilus assembly protein CpaF